LDNQGGMMDLQILYNNPSKHKKAHKRKENPMAKLRKKRNPKTVYRRQDDQVTLLTAAGKPKKVGPLFRIGKVDMPSQKAIDRKRKKLSDMDEKILKKGIAPADKSRLLTKRKKAVKALEESLEKAHKKLGGEIKRMQEKGYGADETLTVKKAMAQIKKQKADIKKADSVLDKELKLNKEFTKVVKSKRKKKVEAPKKKKKASKKASKKGARKHRRRRNPSKIEALSNPTIEVLSNPKKKKAKKSYKKPSKKKKASKKSSKKKSKKIVKDSSKPKSSKKKSSKKKSSKKKSSKKNKSIFEEIFSSKKSKKKGKKKKSSKKKARKGKGKGKKSYKAKALKIKPETKAKKSYKKKSKNKRKSNPSGGVGMASKFEQITKHEVMEATGLAVGGVALKLYNQHAKSIIVNLPGIKNLYQMIPAKAAPLFDGVIDVLLAAAVGHGITYASKGNAKAESISKGLIGAAVVSFAMKATQSAYAVAGKQMNGFVAVPSMDGIIAVPEMNGIIAVPEMNGFGEADFGSFAGDGDFGAIIASPEMEGLGEADFGEADFGEFDYQDEGADF